MSNITVTVEWERPTAFAGEEIRCKITFRNASKTVRSRSPSPNDQSQRFETGRDRWKLGLYRQPVPHGPSTLSRQVDHLSQKPPTHSRRSTISLNAPVGTGKEQDRGVEEPGDDASPHRQHQHKRSVSIISISSQHGGREDSGTPATKQVRNAQKQHVRSASYQGLPSRNGGQARGGSGPPKFYTPQLPSSMRSSTSPFPTSKPSTFQQPREQSYESSSNSKSTANGSVAPQVAPGRHKRSGSDFVGLGLRTTRMDSRLSEASGSLPPATADDGREKVFRDLPTNRSLQRVLSPASLDGTPRSSLDLYTHSNHSSETLASEYVSSPVRQQPFWARHSRQGSHLSPATPSFTKSDTLMMGYVQLSGHFTLDGSLVNMAPFEEVKRKGVIGGQGSGGVVGLDHSKRDNGLFGSLGWSSIGQSLGGLLGPQEPSSLREMKGIASSKSIPILSTPQSILFVDLKLEPGESKSYMYSHPLPDGLPPSHKGRAMKASYQLVIGVQRAKSVDRQHIVRQVDTPFRVLPGVNSFGELSSHDLMMPHVLLKDMATADPIDERSQIRSSHTREPHSVKKDIDDGFLPYVDSLLRKTRQGSNLSLLSPTETLTPSTSDEGAVLPTKERIDAAILQGNNLATQGKSSNRYQIHRDGVKVASIILGRSAYRLGETISSIVDFSGSDTICHALSVTLETFEIVDSAIALRSGASIRRATRRVHAHCTENTIAATRTAFDTIIPLNATPEFSTTGISLEWRLKFEFITEAATSAEADYEPLLEIVSDDERGTITSAVQELKCQSFDASVPIRVFGAFKEFEEEVKPLVFPI